MRVEMIGKWMVWEGNGWRKRKLNGEWEEIERTEEDGK